MRALLLSRFRRRLESGELKLPLSQLCWESVRQELGGAVDALLSKLGAEAADLSTTVAGKTPDTPCTTSLHRGGRVSTRTQGVTRRAKRSRHL